MNNVKEGIGVVNNVTKFVKFAENVTKFVEVVNKSWFSLF